MQNLARSSGLLDTSSVEQLLARMRAGDRESAAAFLNRYGDIIRRRIRGKLGAGMRRLFDSQDVLSTLGRRLDVFVRGGQVIAESEPQLWALVMKIANNAIVDRYRVMERLKRVESEDSELARGLLDAVERGDSTTNDDTFGVTIAEIYEMLENPTDRHMLTRWLADASLVSIAAELGISPEAARQRWKSIRDRLKQQLHERQSRDQ